MLLAGLEKTAQSRVKLVIMAGTACTSVVASTAVNVGPTMASADAPGDGWVNAVKKVILINKTSHHFICNNAFFYVCYSVCPEGHYGDHCMEACNCPGPNFLCHPAEGCKCKIGFKGKHPLYHVLIYKSFDVNEFLCNHQERTVTSHILLRAPCGEKRVHPASPA